MASWTIYLSFIGAALLLALRPRDMRWVRGLALGTALAGLVLGMASAARYPADPAAPLMVLARARWIPSLGIEYYLAADGISLTLVVLTGIASVAGVLFSWNIERRAAEYFALYLALIGGVYGVFLSFDWFLLFVFYEVAIVPKYFLIAIWGSTRREYGAMKLALYSLVGSALVLVGMLAAYGVSGGQTFNLIELAQGGFSAGFQKWAFPVVFVGFAVLAGIWPLHTWAPTGHVAAPTAASMLLAGVVMKLGAYGALRVGMMLFPQGAMAWRPLFAGLGVIGILYGACVALVQRDFKFVIGYSSVSHMGFVLLGLMTLNATGVGGAVMQMFSHGIIAGLLFAVVGRMVYDRMHTRDLADLEGMALNRVLPFAGLTFAVACAASMGVPGFSGFISELLVVIGAWKAFPPLAVLAGVGIVVGAAYTLRVLQKSFFGDHARAPVEEMGRGQSLTWPERAGAVLLMAATLVVGLYPSLLLDIIMPSLQAPWMQAMLKGGQG